MWSGAGSGEYGLYKVTSGTDYAGVLPLIQYHPSAYYIDVNQVGIDSSNNAYVAGAFYGYSWESAYSGGSYQIFTQFASGLGDTESLAIIRAAVITSTTTTAQGVPEFGPAGLSTLLILLVGIVGISMMIRMRKLYPLHISKV